MQLDIILQITGTMHFFGRNIDFEQNFESVHLNVIEWTV